MNKLVLAFLVVCIFNFTSATFMGDGLSEYSWRNCQKTFIDYTNYRETQTEQQIDEDQQFFQPADGTTLISEEDYNKKDYYKKLNDVSKSFLKDCVIPYYNEERYGGLCKSEKQTCLDCRQQEGCKTYRKGNSPQQAKKNEFEKKMGQTCQYSDECSNKQLKNFALGACQEVIIEDCLNEWLFENLSDDVCVIYLECSTKAYYSFGAIAKFSVAIVIAFLAL